jgi:DNA polymerase delta subunit 1
MYRKNSKITLLQVVGMNWIEIPAGQYKLVSEKDKKSTCQIELKVK